jgi:hypothetical protein
VGGDGTVTGKPPCIGICHYNRLFGIYPDPVEEAERKTR